MQQSLSYVQQKSTERINLVTQHDALATTSSERLAVEATRAALAPYVVMTAEVLRLSADPRTKLQAVALLRDQLEPLYAELLARDRGRSGTEHRRRECRQRSISKRPWSVPNEPSWRAW